MPPPPSRSPKTTPASTASSKSASHEPADFPSEIDRAKKVLAANALYNMCLSTQNAARLAHPATKAAKDEATLVARNRFLLDEFAMAERRKR